MELSGAGPATASAGRAAAAARRERPARPGIWPRGREEAAPGPLLAGAIRREAAGDRRHSRRRLVGGKQGRMQGSAIGPGIRGRVHRLSPERRGDLPRADRRLQGRGPLAPGHAGKYNLDTDRIGPPVIPPAATCRRCWGPRGTSRIRQGREPRLLEPRAGGLCDLRADRPAPDGRPRDPGRPVQARRGNIARITARRRRHPAKQGQGRRGSTPSPTQQGLPALPADPR